MSRFTIAILVMALSINDVAANALAQDRAKDYELPDSIALSAVFRDAAPADMRVKSHVTSYGELVVSVKLPNISVTNTGQSNLPNDGKRMGDWVARFVVVPKLSDSDIAAITQAITAPSGSKTSNAVYETLVENLPDLVSKDHGYRVSISRQVPTEAAQIRLVKQFIAKLAKTLHAVEPKRNSEQYLQLLLLDER